MISRDTYIIGDGKSDFLFSKLIKSTQLGSIFIIENKSKVVKIKVWHLVKMLFNFKILVLNKLYSIHKTLFFLSKIKTVNKGSQAILVYHSFNPYVHFALFICGFSKVICIVPYFLVKRHVSCKYLHPNCHFVVQSFNDLQIMKMLNPRNVSVLGSLHLSINYKEFKSENKYDLGFISQLTEEYLMNGVSWFNLINNIESAVKECLINSKTNELAILLRHPSHSHLSNLEKKFYWRIVESHNTNIILNFLYPDEGRSYYNLNLCNILVTVNSNLAYEALSVGVKVIFYIKYELNSDYYTHPTIFSSITVNADRGFENIYSNLKNDFYDFEKIKVKDFYKNDLPMYNNLYLINLIKIINE
jgi:hypothetical protein